MTSLIAVDSLVKDYGRIRALNGVSLEIAEPGLVGLVGKNGAGKTTLLALLSGALRLTTGTMRILGQPCGHPSLFGRIGVLTQDAAFRRSIPVRRQLLHLARLGGLHGGSAGRAIDELLDRMGDRDIADRRPGELSFGQRKRLAIVQALAGNPEVILLDEVTAGLDPPAAGKIRELIRERAGQAAVLLSSHNLYEIEDVCSRVIVIDKGRLVRDADISSLTAGGDTLKLTLDRILDDRGRQALSRIEEITEVVVDKASATRVTIFYVTADINGLQLRIQETLGGLGYSVVSLSRIKPLADGIAGLVDQD